MQLYLEFRVYNVCNIRKMENRANKGQEDVQWLSIGGPYEERIHVGVAKDSIRCFNPLSSFPSQVAAEAEAAEVAAAVDQPIVDAEAIPCVVGHIGEAISNDEVRAPIS